MVVDANNLYGWAMSQEMLNGEFEWVSQDERREMELLLKDATGRIAIFDVGLFNHRVTDKENKSLIFEVDLEYLSDLHDRVDDCPLAPQVMTIDPKKIGE